MIISVMGSGWLGIPMAGRLVAQGHQVKLSTTTSERLPELESAGASAHLVDIENIGEDIQQFLQSDILVINITSKNIDAFRNLIEEIEASTISKVLFVSSTSVYGNNNSVVTEDDDEESPDSLLFQIENLLRASDRFTTTVIRFAGLVGGRRHPGRFFRSGKQVRLPDAPINLIHRDDCLEIISRIIETDAWGEVFNGCSDTHPLKRDYYSAAAKSIGMQVPSFSETEHTAYKIIGNDKMKRVLGVQLKYPDMIAMLNTPGAFDLDE